jgi:hypothetical protein
MDAHIFRLNRSVKCKRQINNTHNLHDLGYEDIRTFDCKKVGTMDQILYQIKVMGWCDVEEERKDE